MKVKSKSTEKIKFLTTILSLLSGVSEMLNNPILRDLDSLLFASLTKSKLCEFLDSIIYTSPRNLLTLIFNESKSDLRSLKKFTKLSKELFKITKFIL